MPEKWPRLLLFFDAKLILFEFLKRIGKIEEWV